jgi:predicted metal-dependent hydrolase
MGLVQLVLDLFAPAPPGGSASPRVVSPAPEDGEASQAHRLRQIALAGQVVPYVLKRVRRRTIGMLVGADGLEVRAPRWVGLKEIEAALHEKADWIVRKLADTRALKQKQLDQAIEWRDGAVFPYLGGDVIMCLGSMPTPAAGSKLRHPHLHRDDPGRSVLFLGLPPQALPEQIRDAVQTWIMRQAKPYFTERLDFFAPQAGVRWTHLGLSGARTRWGSASADGRIRLNWRLMHLKPALIDYVVVHELSHLRVMDHSPQFWDAVGQVMPDYSVHRKALREHALNTDL